MRVDVVGKGAGRGGPEVREEFMLSVERDNGEVEFLEDRSGQSRQWDGGNRGFDNRGQEVLNRDVHEWDVVDDFLKLKMDIHVLCFNGWGVLELRA